LNKGCEGNGHTKSLDNREPGELKTGTRPDEIITLELPAEQRTAY